MEYCLKVSEKNRIFRTLLINNHVKSIANQIEKRIKSRKRGTFIFSSDFVDIATPENVTKVLQRMMKAEKIIRVCQGVYYYPRIDTKYGLGVIKPTTIEIALAIAKRDGVDIFPTGSYALHTLGLSTQVPANAVFITNGSPRKINVGRKKGILFKHSDNAHNFEFRCKEMQLVVAALKEIGEGLATEEELATIKEVVEKVPENQVKHDLALAPNWILKLLKTL